MNPRKIIYYLNNIALDAMPKLLFRAQRDKILGRMNEDEQSDIADRVNYYNKTSEKLPIADNARRIDQISLDKSFYYYDLKEHARYFPKKFRLNYQFGDITTIPEVASFVKSRPIRGDNANSVLMNLDKFRHFYFPRDVVPFDEKKAVSVWRGGEHNPKRVELMRRYRGHPLCDVGYTHVDPADSRHSPFLRPSDQMAYRYIISIEGNDVATNLKWILASNSLCIMPAPVYETWFMEGRLKAGEHYVEVSDDFENLEDKIVYYERHPDEAKEIVRNANRFVEQFFDARLEQIISLLVMYKYFVATGQIEADGAIARMIWPS